LEVTASARKLLAALVVLLFLLSGCETPRDDALVFAIATAPASLHPLHARDAASERINALLYAPLVAFDARNRPVPGQVSWQALSDIHYRLHLVPHPARFTDGSLPSIADVAATLRAAMDRAASPHATTLGHIRELAVHDSLSLDVFLQRADPRFAGKLHLGLAPADRLADPERLARNPVGNGRFDFVAWDAQQNLLLQRRTDGRKLRFEVVPDPTMRALKLMRGEVHLLQNDLPYEMYPMLAKRPGIELQTSPGTTFSYLGFNLADPVTGDIRVRQAIAHAIDRGAILRHLFQGYAVASNTLLTAEHWASPARLPSYQHDPDRARALLAQTGHGPDNPLHLSYKTSTDPFRLRVAAALQAQLAAVGIQLDIRSYEWGTFFADIKAGNFQLYSLSWVGIRSPDIFRYVFHSASQPPDGANRGRYASAWVDALIEQAERLPAAQAAPLYHRLQEGVHTDLVYVPLWHEHNLLLTRGLRHAMPRRDGSYGFLEQVSLADE
jgi:peptide/nickel transport system substrate-binding protein